MFFENTSDSVATITKKINQPNIFKIFKKLFFFFIWVQNFSFMINHQPLESVHLQQDLEETLPTCFFMPFFLVGFLNPSASPSPHCLNDKNVHNKHCGPLQRVTHLYSLVKKCKPLNNQECAIKHQHACAKFSKATSPVLYSLPVAQSVLSSAVLLGSFYVS